MAVKENDFVYVTYTGKTTEGFVFESTDEKTAKDKGLFQKGRPYGPALINVGGGQLLKGLDHSLIGKKENESYTVTIKPEDAFGKKKADAIKLLPVSRFKEENIQLHPGMQVTVNEQPGIVKTVSGNRALVDFNHPLSSKEIVYDVTVGTIETDVETQVKSLLKGLPGMTVSVTDSKATIEQMFDLPPQYKEVIEKQIKNATAITDITFTVKEQPKTEAKKE